MRKRKRSPGKAVALALAGWLTAAAMAADGKAAQAMIAGTVFRDSGFALPRATVTASGKERGKKKVWKTAADARGEFHLRVPAGPAQYNLVVTAQGYGTYEKVVTLAADERIDLSIILEAEPAKP